MERVSVTIDRSAPSCESLRKYLAEIFVSLDARPRRLMVTLDVRNDAGVRFFMDYSRGEVLFGAAGMESVAAPLRNRYIPEHPMPLALPVKGVARFVLVPTTGNRVRARLANFAERLFR